jgi:cytochrome c oxidase subunit 2
MKKRLLAGALLAFLSAPALAAAAQTPAASSAGSGYDQCTRCHGANGGGNQATLAPALAGIERWYLTDQLRVFRERHEDQDLAAPELDAIANQLAKLPAVKQTPTLQGNAGRGRRLYMAQCSSCHGARAEGSEVLHAPALARLNDWYVVASFRRYQSGARGADTAPVWAHNMYMQARSLPADFAIEDVAGYLITLGPR